MSPHLPRASFWLAAVAAGCAVVLQGVLQAVFAAVAVGAGFIAYTAWRAGLARRLKVRRSAAESPGAPWFDDAAVAEAEAGIARAAHEANGFEAALHAVALALQGDIGARMHRVYAIDAAADPAAEGAPVLLELFARQPGFRAVARPCGPREDAMARAIRERREVAAFPMALAVPVCRFGEVVAVIEWRAIDIAIGLGEVARLLRATRSALDRAAAADPGRAAAAAAADDDSAWPDTLLQSAGHGRS